MIGDYNLNGNDLKIRVKKPKSMNPDKRIVYKSQVIYLPDDEVLKKFIELYPTTPNKELTKLVERGQSYVSTLGNYLGLKKTEEFMQEQRVANSKRSVLPQFRHKNKPPKGVQPEWLKGKGFGTPNGYRIPKWWYDETREKRIADRKKLIAQERMRINVGLPQKTKLNLNTNIREHISRRWYLTNRRGYVEVERNVYVYDENTKRAKKIEKRPGSLRFYSKQEYQEQQERKKNVVALHTWEDRQGGFSN